ncbi:MAG: orotidine-5'-phosphate decarboxylase [Treponema sp.]|nr:orotidine-5'-phosphate decarboxylase [Treponema sp.]
MQLLQELAVKNGPLCVGLDTDPSYIPESIIKNCGSVPNAVLTYNRQIINRVVADKSACCFKVQIAYYEAMGIEGLKVYAETLKSIKTSGLIAISDIKRGDIAATADAYAKAHFSGDFETDIITVNPYMGFDTLKPFTSYCAKEKDGKGIFVLLRTSNPGMKDIEQQELKSGERVLDKVGQELESIANEYADIYDDSTCSPVGAVVGCTEEEDAKIIRNSYKNVFFLIPGYVAQGGPAKIARTLLTEAGGTVNSSRGILCAWKKDSDLQEKILSNSLTIKDIADSAAKASIIAKNDLISI